jgi:hypothetical protein
MPIAKVPSAAGGKNNHAPKRGAAAVVVAGSDEWFEPETTQVDARLKDRSDWARPADPGAQQAIEKMVEECLVDVPVHPIEDHRAGPPAAQGQADAPPSRARGRRMLIAVAGVVAVVAVVWLLVQSNLVRF